MIEETQSLLLSLEKQRNFVLKNLKKIKSEIDSEMNNNLKRKNLTWPPKLIHDYSDQELTFLSIKTDTKSFRRCYYQTNRNAEGMITKVYNNNSLLSVLFKVRATKKQTDKR